MGEKPYFTGVLLALNGVVCKNSSTIGNFIKEFLKILFGGSLCYAQFYATKSRKEGFVLEKCSRADETDRTLLNG